MNDWPINPIDLTVLIVLVLSAGLAFFKGFVSGMFSVASWIGAIVVTIYGFSPLRPLARGLIETPQIADTVTGVGLFVISLILFSLAGSAISERVRQSRIGAIDRSLGFLFGLARGGFLLCVMYVGLAQILTRNDAPAWVGEAKSLDLLHLGAAALVDLLPEGTRPSIDWENRPAGSEAPAHRLSTPEGGQAGNSDASGETGYKTDHRQVLDRVLENLNRSQPQNEPPPGGKSGETTP